MKIQNKNHGSGCPIAFGLDVFGDKWSFLIIREIMLRGKKTYGEFLELEEGIATNILASRLKSLEINEVITKTRDPENRRSFIYNLTPKGLDLAPIIIEIILWSGRHDNSSAAKQDVLDQIKKDRTVFEEKIRKRAP